MPARLSTLVVACCALAGSGRTEDANQRSTRSRLSVSNHLYVDFMENQLLFDDGVIDRIELERLIRSARDDSEVRALLHVLTTMRLSRDARKSEILGKFLEDNKQHFTARLLATECDLVKNGWGTEWAAEIETAFHVLDRLTRGELANAFDQAKEDLRTALPYLALRHRLSAEVAGRLFLHPFFGSLAIDAVPWSPHKDYYWGLLRHEGPRIGILETPLHMEMFVRAVGLAGSQEDFQFLDAAVESVPHFEDRGRTVYVMHALPENAGQRIMDGVRDARDMRRLSNEFRKSANALAFVSQPETLASPIRRKAWVVAWQAPELFGQLLSGLMASDEIPINRRPTAPAEYSRRLLAEVIRCARRFPDPRIDVTGVLGMSGHTSVSRLYSFLYLLEPMVGEEHLGILRDLSTDRREIEWYDRQGQLRKGRLLSYWSIGCMGSIDTPEAVACLQALAGDPELDERGRETAAIALGDLRRRKGLKEDVPEGLERPVRSVPPSRHRQEEAPVTRKSSRTGRKPGVAGTSTWCIRLLDPGRALRGGSLWEEVREVDWKNVPGRERYALARLADERFEKVPWPPRGREAEEILRELRLIACLIPEHFVEKVLEGRERYARIAEASLARAFDQRYDEGLAGVLREVLTDKGVSVSAKTPCLYVLAEMSGKAKEVIRLALDDASPEIRKLAAKLLGHMHVNVETLSEEEARYRVVE